MLQRWCLGDTVDVKDLQLSLFLLDLGDHRIIWLTTSFLSISICGICQLPTHGFPSVHPIVIPVSLLPTGALPKLFPPVFFRSSCRHSRTAPSHRAPPSYFPRFPFRPPSRHSRIAPSHRSCLPKLFPPVFFRSSCRHSRTAPSHRSSPQAISQGFPSAHPLVASVSPLPLGALPRRFLTVSPPVASIPPILPHGTLPMLFPTVSPPSTQSSLPSVSPGGALPKLFPTVSPPSTLSSNPYRSLPASVTKREPKHRRCVWEQYETM